jgi:excisionase family DNA binding protein
VDDLPASARERGEAGSVSAERLLTAAEVAEQLGFSAGTILDWFESGELPGIRFGQKGARVRFRSSEIASWLDSHATVGSGQLHESKG